MLVPLARVASSRLSSPDGIPSEEVRIASRPASGLAAPSRVAFRSSHRSYTCPDRVTQSSQAGALLKGALM